MFHGNQIQKNVSDDTSDQNRFSDFVSVGDIPEMLPIRVKRFNLNQIQKLNVHFHKPFSLDLYGPSTFADHSIWNPIDYFKLDWLLSGPWIPGPNVSQGTETDPWQLFLIVTILIID